MSEGRELAKESAALCLICLSFFWTPAAVAGAAAVPAVALFAIGRSLWKNCPEHACNEAVAAALADMQRSGAVPERRIIDARGTLAAVPPGIRLAPAELVRTATDARGFSTALAAQLLDTLVPAPHPDTRSLIEIALTTAFQTLRTRPEFRAALTESVVIEIARGQGVLLGTVQRIETKIDDVSAALGSLATANRDLMEALAARFRIADAFDLSDAALRQELEKKAEDYRRLLKEVADLKGMSARIDNVHAAAMDAIRNLRLDEARGLLRDARVILREESLRPVLEQNARLMEAEADIELLAGDAQAGFDLLSAAADSFAGIDRAEVARRRLRYGEPLYQHGSRYGGPGLTLSARMNRAALDLLDEQRDSQNWAGAQNNLANALQTKGARTAGAEGAALLAEAVAAYRAALRVWTEVEHPVHWATTQKNLANALATQGERTAGREGAALLAEAVAAYRAALRVQTEAEHPAHWAATQINLAIALRSQAERIAGADEAALLAEAAATYRAALRVWTEAEHPVEWAMTQNNLANALRTQGERTAEADGAALLAEAVTACRAALRVRTEAEHPVHWATTQNNLANALATQGARTAGAEGAALLAEAAAAYRAALRVRTEAEHPVEWARTQGNLARVEWALADHDTTADPRPHLEAALAHVEAALRVYDPEHLRYYYGTVTDLRDRLLARLAALPPT